MNTEPIDPPIDTGTHPGYTERLRVPASWLLPVGFLVGTFWFACWLVILDWWAHLPGLLVTVGAVLGLVRFGALRVGADQEGVRAGRDRLPLSALDHCEVLSPTRARVLRGGGADATARYVLRPYIDTAVRIELTEQAAPPPYWYVATRHPERFVATLRALGVACVGDDPAGTTPPHNTPPASHPRPSSHPGPPSHPGPSSPKE